MSRPATALGRLSSAWSRDEDGSKKKGKLARFFSRKRKIRNHELSGSPEPVEPVRLNFLFVGAKASGQTALLL
jgi:hypothetical protein